MSTSNNIEEACEKAHADLIEEYGSEDALWEGEYYKEDIQDQFNELYDKYLTELENGKA